MLCPIARLISRCHPWTIDTSSSRTAPGRSSYSLAPEIQMQPRAASITVRSSQWLRMASSRGKPRASRNEGLSTSSMKRCS